MKGFACYWRVFYSKVTLAVHAWANGVGKRCGQNVLKVNWTRARQTLYAVWKCPIHNVTSGKPNVHDNWPWWGPSWCCVPYLMLVYRIQNTMPGYIFATSNFKDTKFIEQIAWKQRCLRLKVCGQPGVAGGIYQIYFDNLCRSQSFSKII